MTVIFAESALLPEGWQADVRVTMSGGIVTGVETGRKAEPGDVRADILVPGMPNLHSHAFQRAMAGLAEMRGPGDDNFWSWRETMYRFALAVSPDDVEAIATQLYVEMLEAGFTRVGEFHYLHHDRDGRPYGDIAEMGGRIAAASAASGIALTLLPVFYARGSFGGQPPNAGQRRFINDVDSFGRLVEANRKAISTLPGALVGIAPHSLRAATPDELAAILPLADGGPLHIHVAEQVREVEDCIAWSGRRPVEWLLGNMPVDGRWCLIHATHMTPDETSAMAASGAVAGLCPITEANLGDGTFPGVAFRAAGGRFGVGSDSNVRIGVADELAQLEYSQRLAARGRTMLAPAGGSNGRALFDAALAGGSAALGAPAGGIAAGSPADLVSLRADHPTLAGKAGDSILDAWIFTGARLVDGVWVAGRQAVTEGRHAARDAASERFRRTMRTLSAT